MLFARRTKPVAQQLLLKARAEVVIGVVTLITEQDEAIVVVTATFDAWIGVARDCAIIVGFLRDDCLWLDDLELLRKIVVLHAPLLG